MKIYLSLTLHLNGDLPIYSFSQEYKRRYGELPSSTRRSGQSEGSGIITSIFLKLKIDRSLLYLLI